MKEFANKHPYLTIFLAIVALSGLFYTIRFIAAARLLKKQQAAQQDGSAQTAPSAAGNSLLSEFETNPYITGAASNQYDKDLGK